MKADYAGIIGGATSFLFCAAKSSETKLGKRAYHLPNKTYSLEGISRSIFNLDLQVMRKFYLEFGIFQKKNAKLGTFQK